MDPTIVIMTAAEIRRTFLSYFAERGHEIRPSSSLIPADDPTLLFTNAGMVQFKKVFLGQEPVPYSRAATSQKCVRAGGKHNDLEEVGLSAGHHTFFEMLGNFSFGDYFKKDAVNYAWELLTDVYGLERDRLFVTVHHSDDEAADLWIHEVGVPPGQLHRLGDADNFWQMADTGPCGPCSELLYDLRPESERGGAPLDTDTFVALGDSGRIVELWNLVFMQFDRGPDGDLEPLPAPSIDTGAGLERLTAVLQGVESNYQTDLFRPLLAAVEGVVGAPYDPQRPDSASYRVIADHARAVAFLLADGVYPRNEGRGYVLRRILRRAVRHAWLMGRREPTIVDVVGAVVDAMGSVYPELEARRDHLLSSTRSEEERFLATIEGGMVRFEELAPAGGAGTSPVLAGEEAFRLYDTFGFPLDLTEIMARERGFEVDVGGFERALQAQRERSRMDRARGDRAVQEGQAHDAWTVLDPDAEQEFVGYQTTDVETEIVALMEANGRIGLELRENPFYVEAGGQVSDSGEVRGSGWSVAIDDVRRAGSRTAVFGRLEGRIPAKAGTTNLRVRASVSESLRRDTERNHTATHLLHAALRHVLGDHVVQRGSLVAPDRLRFDFAHLAPLSEGERSRVEEDVNRAVWGDDTVLVRHLPYEEALRSGAVALFGEKYAEVVRVVEIPSVSMELCGGTHVRHTGEIGLFKILAESGVAAGVRRVEARTGPGAFDHFRAQQALLEDAAGVLKTSPENVVNRARQLVSEKEELELLLSQMRLGGSSAEEVVVTASIPLEGASAFDFRAVRVRVRDADDARAWGDSYLRGTPSGVAVLASEMVSDKLSLFAFVSDDLVGRGIRADEIVSQVAAETGGKGGGRPHLAQAGVGDVEKVHSALLAAEGIVRRIAGRGAG